MKRKRSIPSPQAEALVVPLCHCLRRKLLPIVEVEVEVWLKAAQPRYTDGWHLHL